MSTFHKLDNRDADDVLSLLSGEPHLNMLMLSNVESYGMEAGETVFHGEYFGCGSNSGLEAVVALYGLGSLLMYGVSDEAFDGIGDYLTGLELSPYFIVGRQSQVERVLTQIKGRIADDFRTYPTELMVLRDPVRAGVDTNSARPANDGDLDDMVRLAAAMEEEVFEGTILAKVVMRELLSGHVDDGTAFVFEDEGKVVSKAEATLAGNRGAQVGGVYTIPAHRGRGLSKVCLSLLCRRVLHDVEMVALNVQKDNIPALSLYRTIGFRKVDDCMQATLVYH